jgi:AcrR family transcriptional regulator
VPRVSKSVRYEDIKRTALRLFVSQGFHSTSMDDIAREVGLLKGSLYHYISSKDELIFKVLEESVSDVLQRVEGVYDPEGDGYSDHSERLAAIVRTEVAAMIDHREEVRLWIQERGRLPKSCDLIDSSAKQVDAHLWQTLVRGADDGAWSSVRLRVRFQAIVSMLAQLPLWYDRIPDLAKEDVCDDFAKFAIAILHAPESATVESSHIAEAK